MKFNKTNITLASISQYSIDWSYQSGEFDNLTNYQVKISMSSSQAGNWQEIIILPYYVTNYLYLTDSKRWITYYFKLDLINTRSGKIEDTIVDTVLEIVDPIVKKINKKYEIMLKRVGHPVKVFKRKKIGLHCRECWNDVTREVIKSNCSTCYETSYGNNSLLGLEALTIDGLLKINSDGYLEFFKQNYNFNYYRIQDEEAAIEVNDEFLMYQGNEVVFRSRILSVSEDRFVLNSQDATVIDKMINATFSVFHEQDSSIYNRKMQWNIIKVDNTHFKIFGDFTQDTVKLKANGIELNIISRTNKYVLCTGSYTFFNVIGELFELGSEGEIVAQQNIINYCIYDGTNIILKLDPTENISIGSSFYMEYLFNGKRDFIINNKTKRLANNDKPETALAFFEVIDTLKLELKTLSNYENAEEPEDYMLVFEEIFSDNVYFTARNRKLAMALEIIKKRLKPNMKFKLPHLNFKKDVFRGCGILFIDLSTGNTFRGQNWNGTEFDVDDLEFDFYVNPETGEIDTLNLQESFYEIRYVYELDNIKFSKFFLPVNPKYENGKLIDLDKWIFQHPKLINKNIEENNILAVGFNPYYKELVIDTYDPLNGKLYLKKGNFDFDFFWTNITDKTFYSIDYKYTGGYFAVQNSYINFMNVQPKTDMITDFGNKNVNEPIAIMNIDIIIDPGDLIYDTINKNFYSVSIISSNAKRGQPVYQRLQLHEMPYYFQNKLKELLSR